MSNIKNFKQFNEGKVHNYLTGLLMTVGLGSGVSAQDQIAPDKIEQISQSTEITDTLETMKELNLEVGVKINFLEFETKFNQMHGYDFKLDVLPKLQSKSSPFYAFVFTVTEPAVEVKGLMIAKHVSENLEISFFHSAWMINGKTRIGDGFGGGFSYKFGK
jgi:hypothetical protein